MTTKYNGVSIDPKQEYSLVDIREQGMFPWAANIATIRRMVRPEMFGHVLKARIDGEGRLRRYRIKGANIIRFLEEYGKILTTTKRKYKTKQKNAKNNQGGGRKKGHSASNNRRRALVPQAK